MRSVVVLRPSRARGVRAGEPRAAVGRYLDALKIGNPALMRLAPGAKYIENRKELPVGEGLLRSGLELDFHRSFLDAEACETFTEIIHTGSHPYVIGTRLKVADGNIAEIESLVTDRDDWLFNAENYLKYSRRRSGTFSPRPGAAAGRP